MCSIACVHISWNTRRDAKKRRELGGQQRKKRQTSSCGLRLQNDSIVKVKLRDERLETLIKKGEVEQPYHIERTQRYASFQKHCDCGFGTCILQTDLTKRA